MEALEWLVSLYEKHGAGLVMAVVFGLLLLRCMRKQDQREQRLAEVVQNNATVIATIMERSRQ